MYRPPDSIDDIFRGYYESRYGSFGKKTPFEMELWGRITSQLMSENDVKAVFSLIDQRSEHAKRVSITDFEKALKTLNKTNDSDYPGYILECADKLGRHPSEIPSHASKLTPEERKTCGIVEPEEAKAMLRDIYA